MVRKEGWRRTWVKFVVPVSLALVWPIPRWPCWHFSLFLHVRVFKWRCSTSQLGFTDVVERLSGENPGSVAPCHTWSVTPLVAYMICCSIQRFLFKDPEIVFPVANFQYRRTDLSSPLVIQTLHCNIPSEFTPPGRIKQTKEGQSTSSSRGRGVKLSTSAHVVVTKATYEIIPNFARDEWYKPSPLF